MPHRIDDWASTTSSLGGAKDKHTGLTFLHRPRLSPGVVEAMYGQNSIAARIIDRIVDDGFRTPWKIVDVVGPDADIFDADEIKADLDALGLSAAEEQSARWARLYGGALTVIALVDGGPPERPIEFGPHSRLLRFVAIPAERALPLEQDVGIMSPTYGRTLLYQITGLASTPLLLHHTRAIAHEPIKLPLEAQQRGGEGNGWGPSELDRIFDDLGRYGATGAHAVSMMYGGALLYMQLDGYRVEAQTKEGMDRIQRRADATRQALDSFGLLVMDSADTIGAIQNQLSGAGDLMQRAENRLAAATSYPREILFNESPAGLNAGELSGPQEIYFASVDAWRQREINPGLRRGVEIAIRLRGLRIDSFGIEWDPLWSRSDEGDSEIHARNAAADAIYIDKGALSADEVRDARFLRGEVGMISLPEGPVAEPLDLAPDDVVAEEQAAAPPAGAPEDSAMNGAQIASMLEILKSVNLGELTYAQGIGALEVAFVALRGRAASVLGPPPAAATDEEKPDVPGDRVTVQEAAIRFGLKTRSITRLIEKGLIQYWGFGAHRVVSLAEVEAAAKAHEAEAEDPSDPNDQGPEDGTPDPE